MSEPAASLRGQEPPSCYGEYDPNEKLGANYLSLVGQLNSRLRCYELLEAEEKRRGTAFDWVVLTRPDLTWWSLVTPICLLDPSKTLRHHDWVFMGPREQAGRWLLDLPSTFFSCADEDMKVRAAVSAQRPSRLLHHQSLQSLCGGELVCGGRRALHTRRQSHASLPKFLSSLGQARFRRNPIAETITLMGEFQEMVLPAQLTRQNRDDQPHNLCPVGMHGIATQACLDATDYNPCGGAFSAGSCS